MRGLAAALTLTIGLSACSAGVDVASPPTTPSPSAATTATTPPPDPDCAAFIEQLEPAEQWAVARAALARSRGVPVEMVPEQTAKVLTIDVASACAGPAGGRDARIGTLIGQLYHADPARYTG